MKIKTRATVFKYVCFAVTFVLIFLGLRKLAFAVLFGYMSVIICYYEAYGGSS
jgi:hypothetical protein